MALQTFIGTILVTFMFLAYCSAFQKKYSIFSPSSVGVYNHFLTLKRINMLNYDEIKSKLPGMPEDSMVIFNAPMEIYKVNKKFLYFEKERHYIFEHYDLKAIQKMNFEIIKEHKGVFIMSLVKNFSKTGRLCSLFSQMPSNKYHWKDIHRLFGLHMITLYYLVIIGACYFVWLLFKRKTFPWLTFFLYGCIASNLIVVVLAAPDAWSRLIFPSIPLILILFGMFLSHIRWQKKLE